MSWLDSHSLSVAGASVSYAAVLFALLAVVGGFLLASKVSARIRVFGGAAGETLRWRAAAAQVAGYVLRLVTVVFALQVTGINIASVLAAGAVLAVGIGIAMQKVAENFVSGIILFAERSIREGDIIEFEDKVARVRHMGIRATIAVTLDDEEIIVPNSILAQSAVKNLTLTEVVYRLRVDIGVAYASDVEQTIEVLHAAAAGLTWRDTAHEPVVLLVAFADSSINFEVSVWSSDVWGQRRGQSKLRVALWRALRDHGISIPFPQVDVHFPQQPPTRKVPMTSPDERFDPEAVDLAAVQKALHTRCGNFVDGDVVGRTVLRDEVMAELGCSTLEAERVVDTMIGRRFLLKETMADGRIGWSTSGAV